MGKTTCSEQNEPVEINCDVSNVKKSYTYIFGVQFKYTFQSWPLSIYDTKTNKCTKDFADDDIIKTNAVDTLKIGNFPTEFKFNPYTEQFYCPSNVKYKINYKTLVLEPRRYIGY